MVWWRGDDRSHMNAKLLAADLDGTGLHFRAVSWSACEETDGRIPAAVVPMLAPGKPPKVIDALVGRLVQIGLWRPIDGAYEINDFLVYNPTHASLEAKREAERQRLAARRRPTKRSVDVNTSPTSRQPDGKLASGCDPVGEVLNYPVPEPEGLKVLPPPNALYAPAAEEEERQEIIPKALNIIAERRMARARNVVDPQAWLKATASGLGRQFEPILGGLDLAQFVDANQLADYLEPPKNGHRPADPHDQTALAAAALRERAALPPCRDCDSTGWLKGEPENGKCTTCRRLL